MVLAIKFSNPFPLSLLDIECVVSIDFFQDGNGKVIDVVITLTEVMDSGLADSTVLNVSKVQGPPILLGLVTVQCDTYLTLRATQNENLVTAQRAI